jgi:hypothetical protein
MPSEKRIATKELVVAVLRMFPDETLLDLLYERMPFELNRVIMLPEEGMVVLDTPEKIRKAIDFRFTVLDRSKSLQEVFFWITKPNRLQIFHFITCMYSLNKVTYHKLLKDIWVTTEFPHQMAIPKIVSLFKNADAELLMTEDEKCIYTNLPESVTVYRGCPDKRAKVRGLSWTTRLEKADWFANRFNHDGTVYQAEIRKKHIFMFTDERKESECVVNLRYLKNLQKIHAI